MIRLPAALRRLKTVAAAAALATATALLGNTAWAAEVGISRVWQFDHTAPGAITGQKAEIVAYDALTDTLWVAGTVGIDVLDRASGQRVAQIDVRHLGAVNSVAIHDGLAALAVEAAPDRTQAGAVVFFDTRTRRQDGAPVAVGALPDMLTFTPDGSQVLVANEATPNPRPAAAPLSADDPVGSVSIVDVHSRAVTTLAIDPAIPGFDTLRLFPTTRTLPTQPASYSAYGPEPEYIAVDKTGKRAYVGLQEANGIAVLNLQTQAFERIYSLGLKDFSLPGNEIDPSDQDGRQELRSVPIKSLYQPDTLATYEHRGRTYLVMANEGDARDNGNADGEDERRGTASPQGSPRLVPASPAVDWARTVYSNVESTPSSLVKFGGHSFSIRTPDGDIVYDSGSLLDREAIRLGLYDDGRSDNKGAEPEGLALLHIKGRVLAFVGLERSPNPAAGQLPKAAFAVFDITDPRDVRYIDMIVGEGDRSPEGLVAFKAGSRYYVAVAYEVSDTTSLYEVTLDKAQGPKR